MKNNIFSGFLFDKNWEESLRKLKPKQFHQLFWELYDYQMSQGRIKIPPHDDNPYMSMAVSFIEPQILNRLYGARVFSKSSNAEEQPQDTSPPPTGGRPPPTEGATIPPHVPKLSQVKLSQVEIRQGKASQASPPKVQPHPEHDTIPNIPACLPCLPQESEKVNTPQGDETTPDASACLPCLPPERKEKKEMNDQRQTVEEGLAPPETINTTPDTIEGASLSDTNTSTVEEGLAPPETTDTPPDRQQKKGYGIDRQVMLTPEEYDHLTKDLGIPIAYIDHFAERNAKYEHRIQNHAHTIEAWWEQDKHNPMWQAIASALPTTPPLNVRDSNSSFDTEDFFKAAVKRTFGYGLEFSGVAKRREGLE